MLPPVRLRDRSSSRLPTEAACGLYIQVPFCERRCSYCSFYSTTGSGAQVRERFVQRICTQIERIEFPAQPATLYLGGGTPSLLNDDQLSRLLRAVQSRAASPLCESTLELNPADFCADRAIALARQGWTRFSLGLQSTSDVVRRRIGRAGSLDVDNVRTGLECARREGVQLSLDLMAGVPGLSGEDLLHDLDAFEDLVDHYSVYLLSVPAGHALSGTIDEDRQAEQLYWFAARARERGYEWYEVSNFARPGSRSQHNQLYWRSAPTLALGPGAVAFDGRNRWRWPADLRWYLQADDDQLVPELQEQLGDHAMACERLLLGLRTSDGAPVSLLERMGSGAAERCAALVRDAVLRERNGTVVLSTQYALMVDAVYLRLLGSPEGPA